MRKLFPLTILLPLLVACKHEPQPLPEVAKSDLPADIEAIMVKRCGTSCHNDASFQDQANLRLYSWSRLFEGGSSGATVVPYDVDFSPLLYFVNRDSLLGPIAIPAMPYNGTDPLNPINPLTRDEYLKLRDWIAAGAPSASGEIPFSSNAATRQKIYLTMQGCDAVAVVDAASRQVMRYIRVGKTPQIETPHSVRVSADGQYAYVSFSKGEYLQKIDTRTDQVVAEAYLGPGAWNIVTPSEDGMWVAISDWRADGRVLVLDAATLGIQQEFGGPGIFQFPHATAASADFDTLWVTAQHGNVVYKFARNGAFLKNVRIDTTMAETLNPGTHDPHEIIFSPDRSKYFVTCEASDEVRVLDTRTDRVLAAIPVGNFPQEMAVSEKYPYLFVTCTEDASVPAPFRGTVYVINYQTLQVVRRIDGGFTQPHGIAVDDREGTFYVASRNVSTDGPAPHHSSACGGRNGYFQVFSMATFEPAIRRRYEVSVDPYSAAVRFVR